MKKSLDSNLYSILGKYGLQHVDEDFIEICKGNPLILPKLYRYLGMGLYEVVAQVKNYPKCYFCFEVGGPNGYECDDNTKFLNNLKFKDSLTFSQVINKLVENKWSEIVSVDQYEGGEIHGVVTHMSM